MNRRNPRVQQFRYVPGYTGKQASKEAGGPAVIRMGIPAGSKIVLKKSPKLIKLIP